MNLQKQVLELIEQVEKLQNQNNTIDSIQKQLELINGNVQFNINLFYAILFGLAATLGVALFYFIKQRVNDGIKEGTEANLAENKYKANKNNPEFIGKLKLSNIEDDTTFVTIEKLSNQPTININTTNGNAKLTINHKELVEIEKGTWTPELFVGKNNGYFDYVKKEGRYYKIGNIVTLNADIVVTLKKNDEMDLFSTLNIRGLPFVCETNDVYGSIGRIIGIKNIKKSDLVIELRNNRICLFENDNSNGFTLSDLDSAINISGLIITYEI